MGGEIGFNSGENEGSTFWFTIAGKSVGKEVPIDPERFDETNYDTARSLRVLLVEDNDLNQIIIKTVLSQFNHVVITVSDGCAAIRALREDNYDLVLMDIRLPKMDGLEATRIIRKEPNEKREIPIISITADANLENQKLHFDAGINDCVTKPIDRQKLLQTINRVLGEDVHVAAEVVKG